MKSDENSKAFLAKYRLEVMSEKENVVFKEKDGLVYTMFFFVVKM